jgi:tetratricopeptide (TPR) repeat protein
LLEDSSAISSALGYLDPIFQDYPFSEAPDILLSESLISLSSLAFQTTWLSVARHHAIRGSLKKAIEEFQALISLLTRHLAIVCSSNNRKHQSIYFEKSCLTIMYSLVELIKISISTGGERNALTSSLLFILKFINPSNFKANLDVSKILLQAKPGPASIVRLGDVLLDSYDINPNSTTLDEIEKTYLAAIEAESGSSTIETLSWYKQALIERYVEKKQETKAPVTTSKTGAKAPAATVKEAVPAKGAPVVKPSPTKPPKKSTAAKPTPPKPVLGKSKVAPLAAMSKAAPVKATETPNVEKKEPIAAVIPEIQTTNHFSPSSEARIGLARTYSRISPNDPRIEEFYNQALTLDPLNSDIYIELSEKYEKEKAFEKAALLFSSYPFTQTEDVPTQEELYIHGEISRLFVKTGRLRDPALVRSLIAVGRSGGVRCIEKYTEEMDKKGDACAELMQVYAGIGRKDVMDPDMVTFFRARFWL